MNILISGIHGFEQLVVNTSTTLSTRSYQLTSKAHDTKNQTNAQD